MVAVKRLADIVKPAARTTLRDACAVYRGPIHSCEWQQLLTLLYKGFRLRLSDLLDLCIENIVEISHQALQAFEDDVCEDNAPYLNDEQRTCEVCRINWLRLEQALTNCSYAATNLMRMDILKIMRKYFTVTAVLSPDGCREVMDRKRTVSWSFDVINDAIRNFGFDLNTYCPFGSTLLHLTIARSWTQPEVVEYLLQNGANVDLRDVNGHTALDAALCSVFKSDDDSVFATRQKNIVNSLLKYGARINNLDPTYRAPLDFAMNPLFPRSLHLELAKILIRHGSKVNHDFVSRSLWYSPEQFVSEVFFKTFLPLLRGAGLSLDLFHNPILDEQIFYAGRGRGLISGRPLRPGRFYGGPSAPGRLNSLSVTDRSICKHPELPGECDCFRCLSKHAFEGCQERPESLTFMCRIMIRNELINASEGRSIYSAIDQLPVAQMTKKYLKLENI